MLLHAVLRCKPYRKVHSINIIFELLSSTGTAGSVFDRSLIAARVAGVYESELERVGTVYMLHDTPPHRLHTISAEEVMAPHVQGFRCVETVATVLEVLRSTMHNGFPVFSVDQSQAHEAAKASCRGRDDTKAWPAMLPLVHYTPYVCST